MPLKNATETMLIQHRDIVVLRCLFESRIMTGGHIATLHFNGSGEAAKKRLQKLKAAGLIGERGRKAFEPAILFLTRKAILFLKAQGILNDYPHLTSFSMAKRSAVSDRTLKHELEVMDVKTAFHSAIKSKDELNIPEFTTWPLLCQFKAIRPGHGGEVPVNPDGFIRIQEKGSDNELFEHSFFLELDRSGEVQDILVSKICGYLDYYKSGGYAVRQGADRSAFNEHQFRVLMIFKTVERRNNTAERLLQNNPRLTKLPYLSTFEEVLADPLGKIWIRPSGYYDATQGTRFEPRESREIWGYKRQSAREIFVEQKIRKCRILEDEILRPGDCSRAAV